MRLCTVIICNVFDPSTRLTTKILGTKHIGPKSDAQPFADGKHVVWPTLTQCRIEVGKG